MQLMDLIVWGNIENEAFKIVLWILGWSITTVLKLNRGSIMDFATNALRILMNPKLNPNQRFGLMRELILSWWGMLIDYSQLTEAEAIAQKSGQSVSVILRNMQDMKDQAYKASVPGSLDCGEEKKSDTEKNSGTEVTFPKPPVSPFVPAEVTADPSKP
jgi:hypothetical protein